MLQIVAHVIADGRKTCDQVRVCGRMGVWGRMGPLMLQIVAHVIADGRKTCDQVCVCGRMGGWGRMGPLMLQIVAHVMSDARKTCDRGRAGVWVLARVTQPPTHLFPSTRPFRSPGSPVRRHPRPRRRGLRHGGGLWASVKQRAALAPTAANGRVLAPAAARDGAAWPL
eukprot:360968-Chlamydomonas_euryale.AAC.4